MAIEDPESLVSQLWPDWLDGREKSKEWEAWALGRQPLPVVPDTATAEYLELQKRSTTPWLGLVVQSLVQSLIVDGYRPSAGHEDLALWSAWQANRMDARQSSLYEGAFTTGVAYVAVLPVGSPRQRSRPMVGGDVPVPEWRLYSSAEMTAFYESPHDEYPFCAIAAEPAPQWREKVDGGSVYRAILFDDTNVYQFEIKGGRPMMVGDPVPHGSRVCPIVGFTNRRTITGRAIGEVEPYISVASRIDQDVFDRLVVQRFASWRVRWATGLEMPAGDEDREKQGIDLAVSDLLWSDSPDTKFGSIEATQMDGHLRAPMEDVRMLAAVSQTPPTILTADLTNISAEALAAVDAAFNRKVEHIKEEFGESHEKAFDLTARLMGLEADHSAQVRWRDMESRSMAQTADAYGKLAQMLELPVEVLWDKLGFLSDQDRAEAKRLRAEGGAMGDLMRNLGNGQIPDPTLPAAEQA